MNRRGWFAFALCVCLAIGAAGLAAAADEKKAAGGEGMPPGMEQMMKLAQPGEHHQHLAVMVGDWTYTQKMWMDPSQPPIETKGKASGRSLLGGRFIETVYNGEFMGMPFEGHGIDGYDNTTKKHTGFWVDNMGTMSMMLTGSCDQGGKVTTLEATYLDPMTGKDATYKTISTVVDKDHVHFEGWSKNGGEEIKMMEIEMVRR